MVKTMGVVPKNFMSQGVQVKALYSKGVKVWPDKKLDFLTYVRLGPITGSYNGAAIGGNGKIYCPPYGTSPNRGPNNVLEIDPVTNELSTFGDLDTGSVVDYKFWGAVAGNNGMVYGIPYASRQVLEINPFSKTVSLFGNLGNSSYRWGNGVLAPNGKIYCMPYAFNSTPTQVMVINPSSKLVYMLSDYIGSPGYGHGGVLAPNGKIYCPPSSYITNSNQILVIDTNNDTTYFITAPVSTAQSAYGQAVLGNDNKIYFMPSAVSFVLVLDPLTETFEFFGNIGTGSLKYLPGVLAYDNKIYGFGRNISASLALLQIDTNNRTMVQYQLPNNSIWGAVVAHNKKIYAVMQAQTTYVLVFGEEQ